MAAHGRCAPSAWFLLRDCLGCSREQISRRRICRAEHSLDLAARDQRNIEIQALCLRTKLGVPDCLFEGRYERLLAVWRNVRRRRKWTRHCEARQDQQGDLPLRLAGLHVQRGRYRPQIRMLSQAQLSQDIDLLVLDPARMEARHRAPGDAASAVDLASLDCQEYVVGPVVSADELDLRPEQVLDQQRVDVGLGPWALAAQGGLLRQQILPCLDRRPVPREADDDVLGHAAEPGELSTVELRPAEKGRERQGSRKCANDRAVLWGNGVEVACRPQAAGTGHVLRDHSGARRDVFAHEAAQETRIYVVAPSHTKSDQDRDRPAAVKPLHVGGKS